jgi:hypothetical protein
LIEKIMAQKDMQTKNYVVALVLACAAARLFVAMIMRKIA